MHVHAPDTDAQATVRLTAMFAVVTEPVPAVPAGGSTPATATPETDPVLADDHVYRIQREYKPLHLRYVGTICKVPFHANANATTTEKHVRKTMRASFYEILTHAYPDGADIDAVALGSEMGQAVVINIFGLPWRTIYRPPFTCIPFLVIRSSMSATI